MPQVCVLACVLSIRETQALCCDGSWFVFMSLPPKPPHTPNTPAGDMADQVTHSVGDSYFYSKYRNCYYGENMTYANQRILTLQSDIDLTFRTPFKSRHVQVPLPSH